MASAELQAAITLSQQVRGLQGTVEMLELQVDQLPDAAPEKSVLLTDVGKITATVAAMSGRADEMKAAARGAAK